MRLMVINFEMDRLSRVLAWQQQVVNLLAEACEVVVVLTGRVGDYTPPPNVHVKAIPPRILGVPHRLGARWLVNMHALLLARHYQVDACFVHMAWEWAYYLNPTFQVLRLPVMVWYAHGVVPPRLPQVERIATRMVTSVPQGLRIASDKVRLIGQGVDTATFDLQPLAVERYDLLSVSRITPRKRIDLLLDVMAHLQTIPDAPPLRLVLIGPTLTPADQTYDENLRERVWDLGLQERVIFSGFVPQRYIPVFYRTAFLHINVCEQCALDKTGVEALACGCPVLTSSEAFFDLLHDYPELIIRDEHPTAIAQQVLDCYARRDAYDRLALRDLVVGHHDVHSYIQKLLANLHELVQHRT